MYTQNYKINYETKSRANQVSENKRWEKMNIPISQIRMILMMNPD